MSGSELAFEVLDAVHEVTRGTAVTPPDHVLNMAGTLTPDETLFFPNDQVGELAEYERSEVVRKVGALKATGGADTTKLPWLLNMIMGPVAAGVLAGGELTGTSSLVGGSGFVPADGSFNITVGAPAAGGRQAVIQANTTAGVITSLTIIDPGQHYTSAPALTFTGHTGTGASATAVVSSTATTATIWEFIRIMTADTIKAATFYWGDPNNVLYKAPFGMLNSIKFTGNASAVDGVMQEIDGIAQFPSELTGGSIPALPAISVGPVLVPGRMQFYMEPNTTAPFGTTALTGRIVSAEVTIPTGVTPKYVATGPAGGVTYDHIGRKKTHPDLKVKMEIPDQVQTALYIAGTTVKARVRFNGATAIEGSLYPFLEVDIQGKLGAASWGDLEGTNRTIEFTILGERSAQIASDCRVRVQNSSASL